MAIRSLNHARMIARARVRANVRTRVAQLRPNEDEDMVEFVDVEPKPVHIEDPTALSYPTIATITLFAGCIAVALATSLFHGTLPPLLNKFLR